MSEICKKTGYKLNVLARLSKTLGTKEKMLLFHSFMLSHFNYCSVIWYFSNITNSKLMEKIQHKALRYVNNEFKSSYEELRSKAIPLVYIQRLQRMIEVYKIVNSIGPSYFINMFTLKSYV